jgi:hypothetical protein
MSTEFAAENIGDNSAAPAGLPLAQSLKPSYLFSLLITLLTAAASIVGLLYTDTIYPTAELRHTYVANDAFSLIFGLPILLIAMWLTWRGHLAGMLFWPGAILYGLYNYISYLFGIHFSGLFFVYLTIVILGLYTLIALVACIDAKVVQQRLSGNVPERFGGSVLVLLGTAYILMASAVLISNLTGRTSLPQSDLAVFVADLFMAPAWVIGGVLLWRRQPLGYVGGTGLLFGASMLFIGVICAICEYQFGEKHEQTSISHLCNQTWSHGRDRREDWRGTARRGIKGGRGACQKGEGSVALCGRRPGQRGLYRPLA